MKLDILKAKFELHALHIGHFFIKSRWDVSRSVFTQSEFMRSDGFSPMDEIGQ